MKIYIYIYLLLIIPIKSFPFNVTINGKIASEPSVHYKPSVIIKNSMHDKNQFNLLNGDNKDITNEISGFVGIEETGDSITINTESNENLGIGAKLICLLSKTVSTLTVNNSNCTIENSSEKLILSVDDKDYRHKTHIKRNPDNLADLKSIGFNHSVGSFIINEAYLDSTLKTNNKFAQHVDSYSKIQAIHTALRSVYISGNSKDIEKARACQKNRYFTLSSPKKETSYRRSCQSDLIKGIRDLALN